MRDPVAQMAPARLRVVLLAALLSVGCAAKQRIPLDCVTEEVVVYVDGQLLAEHPDALELRADEPHKIYFKRPGHEPELVVLDTARGDDGRPRLSPANVCVELVPIGLERELTIEAEGDGGVMPGTADDDGVTPGAAEGDGAP
jgi:hypothetical protein